MVILIEFVLIYIVSPIISVATLKKIWQAPFFALANLVGFAVGPLLVSLLQYALFALVPERDPWLYPLIIGLIFLILGVWSRNSIWPKSIVWKRPILNLGSLFAGAVVLFVFVRMIAYPPTWGDVYEYIEQAYVYSQDRALWRQNTAIPFTADSTHYVLNPAIRPGIPMLYSLFFLTSVPTPRVLILTHFVYFYYFVLMLFAVCYGGKLLGLKKGLQIWSVVLTLSSFYVLRFTIFGGKEIILATLALLSLFAMYEFGTKKTIDWKYVWLMGIMMGIGSFINFSGTILAFILGLIFFIWIRYPIKIRLMGATILVGLTLLFGAFEPWNGLVSFVFNPTPLSQGTEVVDVKKIKQAELGNYGLKNNLSVLIRGKLQGFTQPQFFGLIFSIWLFIAIVSWVKGHKYSRLEKLLLLYTSVFFLIIMDPFSLNPHPYAYVLSISPKYSLMLVPIVAVMLSGRRETVLYILSKIPKKMIYGFGLFMLLLLPQIRVFLIDCFMRIFATFMSFTQADEYYISLLNALFVGMGIVSILLLLTHNYWQKHYTKLATLGLFILPTIFLLNNNFGIWGTLRYMILPMPQKMIEAEIDQNNKNAFRLTEYINHNITIEAPIVFLFRDNRIGFFINNRARLFMPYNAWRVEDIETQIKNGGIQVQYFIYTKTESGESILDSKNTHGLAQIGPYFITEVVNEKE